MSQIFFNLESNCSRATAACALKHRDKSAPTFPIEKRDHLSPQRPTQSDAESGAVIDKRALSCHTRKVRVEISLGPLENLSCCGAAVGSMEYVLTVRVHRYIM
jgi:hypothetical protein